MEKLTQSPEELIEWIIEKFNNIPEGDINYTSDQWEEIKTNISKSSRPNWDLWTFKMESKNFRIAYDKRNHMLNLWVRHTGWEFSGKFPPLSMPELMIAPQLPDRFNKYNDSTLDSLNIILDKVIEEWKNLPEVKNKNTWPDLLSNFRSNAI